MPDNSTHTRKFMVWIIVGLLIWGAFHAVGAYMLNFNLWRSVVVAGCFIGFILFWLAAIRSRQQRISRRP